MLLGLHIDLDAGLACRGGGDRPDAGHHLRQVLGARDLEEPGDGRRRRERHDVGRGDLGQAIGIRLRSHGPVGVDHLDVPPLRPQAVGQHVARDLGAGQQHPPAAGRRVGERLEQRLGHEPVGHEVGLDEPLAHRGPGAGADHGDVDATEPAGVADRVEEPARAVGRREHHPVEVADAGRRVTERRTTVDGVRRSR